MEEGNTIACRVCGCTWENACVTEEGPCYWAEDDLCSVCENWLEISEKDAIFAYGEAVASASRDALITKFGWTAEKLKELEEEVLEVERAKVAEVLAGKDCNQSAGEILLDRYDKLAAAMDHEAYRRIRKDIIEAIDGRPGYVNVEVWVPQKLAHLWNCPFGKGLASHGDPLANECRHPNSQAQLCGFECCSLRRGRV